MRQELLKRYRIRKPVLRKRLADFKSMGQQGKDILFAELCFCLCTPQSKARACDKALQGLVGAKLLFNGSQEEIKKVLVSSGVRFHHNKSRYILGARALFEKENLKERLNSSQDSFKVREWFVENVKGLGYKEASHFLRNVGYGEDLAILDRHILKNLKKYGALRVLPKTLTKKNYLKVEKKLKAFSDEVKIPPAELDLLFWSEETGEVFK